MEIALHNQGQVMFRQMLFAKIVPAIKKMDLLSDRQRERFAELGILQFENWADPFADMPSRARPARPRRSPIGALLQAMLRGFARSSPRRRYVRPCKGDTKAATKAAPVSMGTVAGPTACAASRRGQQGRLHAIGSPASRARS